MWIESKSKCVFGLFSIRAFFGHYPGVCMYVYSYKNIFSTWIHRILLNWIPSCLMIWVSYIFFSSSTFFRFGLVWLYFKAHCHRHLFTIKTSNQIRLGYHTLSFSLHVVHFHQFKPDLFEHLLLLLKALDFRVIIISTKCENIDLKSTCTIKMDSSRESIWMWWTSGQWSRWTWA